MPEWVVELLSILKWPACVAFIVIIALLLFKKGILKRLNSIKQVKFKKGDSEAKVDLGKDELETEQLTESKPKLINEEAPAKEEIPKKPKPEKPKDWFSEMIIAFINRDTDKAKEAYGKLQKSEKEEIPKLKNEVIYQSNLYMYGIDSAGLENLYELAKNEKVSAFAWYRIGMCYEKNGELEKACSAYENAVEKTDNDDQYIRYIIELANCLYLNGNKLEAFNRLADSSLLTSDSDNVYKVYEALGKLYGKENDPLSRALALELALENNPSKSGVKFDTAYSYSDADLPLLSMLHYKNLLNIKPENRIATNNLGVFYDKLGLNIKSVDCFRKAADNELPLALGNLSKIYSSSGFKREAMELNEKAKKLENIPGPIAEAITALSNKEEKEEETETKLLSTALEEQRFLRQFAKAYIQKTDTIPKIKGIWQIPEKGELTIEQNDNIINGLSEWDNKKFEIEGKLKNRGLLFKTSEYSYSWKFGKGFGIVSDNQQVINAMLVSGNEVDFLKLTKSD